MKKRNTHLSYLISVLLFVRFIGECNQLTTPEETLKFTSISKDQVTGNINLRWNGIEGQTYSIESSADLSSWTPLLEIQESHATIPRTDTLSAKQFFKISGNTTVANTNVLLLIVDDWGIDSSPIDNPTASNLPVMPSLQRLADQGLRFSNAYAMAMCSPTRASIMTGRYPFRHGVGSPAGASLPESEITLPEAMSESTPHALASFGKWHLGGGASGPTNDGGWPHFEGSLGAGLDDYYNWQKTTIRDNTGPITTVSSTYATTDTTNDAIEWIIAQVDQPWLCWVAYNAPHTPYHDPPGIVAGKAIPDISSRGNRGRYESMLWAMDAEIGRLLDTINMATTTVILIGDNGSPGGVIQSPFTREHSKSTLFEGGTHVPLVIAGANVTTQQSVSDQLVQCVDLFPSILEIAGADSNSLGVTIDGRSLLPVLQGEELTDRSIACEAFGGGVDRPGRAIRENDYKLIIFDNPNSDTDIPSLEFYHLPSDPNELNNILDRNLSSAEQTAYDRLIAKNQQLGGDFNK